MPEKDRPKRERTTLVDQLIKIGLDAKNCRLGRVTKTSLPDYSIGIGLHIKKGLIKTQTRVRYNKTKGRIACQKTIINSTRRKQK